MQELSFDLDLGKEVKMSTDSNFLNSIQKRLMRI